MMPRPRARGPNNPINLVDPRQLARDVHEVWVEHKAPATAILTGPRHWTRMRQLVGFAELSRFWPGGEETFASIPVVVHRSAGTPKVIATQNDLEDALLGGG